MQYAALVSCNMQIYCTLETYIALCYALLCLTFLIGWTPAANLGQRPLVEDRGTLRDTVTQEPFPLRSGQS